MTISKTLTDGQCPECGSHDVEQFENRLDDERYGFPKQLPGTTLECQECGFSRQV